MKEVRDKGRSSICPRQRMKSQGGMGGGEIAWPPPARSAREAIPSIRLTCWQSVVETIRILITISGGLL